jgi:hypothetical protein
MIRQSQVVAAASILLLAGLLWDYLSAKPPALTNEALSSKIPELEAKVQMLEDTRDIDRLQRIYGYYLDKKLWDEIIPLFTENARVEIGGRGIYVGKVSVGHLFKDVVGAGKVGLEYGALHNHMQTAGCCRRRCRRQNCEGTPARIHAGGYMEA